MSYQPGDKVQYLLHDKKGAPHWFDGIIHGVKYTEESSGIIKNMTYLVDTGEDTRVDEYPFDHRDREINKRLNHLVKNGKDWVDAVKEVSRHTDLPDSKPDIERVRQPLQIELSADRIRIPS